MDISITGITDLLINVETYYLDENLSPRTLSHLMTRTGYFELIDDTYVLRINHSVDDPSYQKDWRLGDSGFYITAEASLSNRYFAMLISHTVTPSAIKSVIGDDDKIQNETIPIMARISTISADHAPGFLEVDLTQIRHLWYIKTIRITVPREIGDLWFRRYMMSRLQYASVCTEI